MKTVLLRTRQSALLTAIVAICYPRPFPHRSAWPREQPPELEFRRFWQRLQALGLNAYEARSYLVLVGHPRFKALELAARAHVPRQKIYEVLDSLVEKGFARVIQDRTKLFSAIPPDQALPAYLSAQGPRARSRTRRAKQSGIRTPERSDDRLHGRAGRQRHTRFSAHRERSRPDRRPVSQDAGRGPRRVSGVLAAALRRRSAGCRAGAAGVFSRGPMPADRRARHAGCRASAVSGGLPGRRRRDPPDRQSPDEDGA